MYITPPSAFHAGARPIRGLPGVGAFRPDLGGVGAARAAAAMARAEPEEPVTGRDAGDGRRRRVVARGTELLDALDACRLAGLRGRDPADALARLAAGLGEARENGPLEPGLAEVMLGIETRAAVELAKRSRADRLARERAAG